MNVNELQDAVGNWDATSTDEDIASTSKYLNILNHVEFLGKGEWANYLPAHDPRFPRDFLPRLAKWIGNVEDTAERQLLLEYTKKICFFSHEDFISLYRTAFNGPITRWVIEQSQLRFDSVDFQARLETEVLKKTWFCPVTDSMDINEFYHVNHISGVEHRPSFSTLAMLDPASQESNKGFLDNLQRFMANPDRSASHAKLCRLVLLEDFVGSGSQIRSAVEWAARRLQIPILVVPLIICAPGRESLRETIESFKGLVSLSPVVQIDEEELLGGSNKGRNKWGKCPKMEDFARKVYGKVIGKANVTPEESANQAFGYNQTGCSVVTYSNTPNNSLPLIHNNPKSGTWVPLFPRSSRV